MLINAQRPEQLRLAIVEGKILEDYQVDIKEAGLTRGNIYRGVVANIQPSLNAAFIDLGEERHGFLSADDVLPHAYHRQPPEGARRPRIDQILEKRRQIEVQVTKDGIGRKGPALTTNLAIAGRYLVLMPHDEVRAISRKAEGSEARDKVRDRLDKLKLPENHGVIVRTNGLEQNQTTLNRDLSALLRLWRRIAEASHQAKGAKLLYSDQDLLMQALRDYLDSSMTEVVVDNDEAYAKAANYMRAFMPRSKTRLLRYRERVPLFSRYQLEEHIDRIYERQVPLPSGGSIVIDGTEALTAIDVNSGRATKTTDHEESIFNVNMEAATEIGRQLRLRDIGGLVVIDFIDMRLRKHQRKLEKEMRDAMKADKARHSVSRISANGLVEINRQRIKQALRQRTHRACPTCSGVGSVPSAGFSAQSVLRRIETRAASGMVQAVTVALHPEIADALQNRYRNDLARLEVDFEMHVEVLATSTFSRSEERIDWTARERKVDPAAATLSADDLLTSVKSRRRGGRGRKHGTDDAEIEEQSAELEASDSDTENAAKPARRRGRRRGRKPAAESATGETRQSANTAGDEPAKEPQAAKRGSRGRRGGRAKASDSDAHQVSGEALNDAADADCDAAAASKPKRRRGRRGGRGRRKKTEDAQTPEIATEGKAERAVGNIRDEPPTADSSWSSPTHEAPAATGGAFMFRDSPATSPVAEQAPVTRRPPIAEQPPVDEQPKPKRKRPAPRRRATLAEPAKTPAPETPGSAPAGLRPTLAELSGRQTQTPTPPVSTAPMAVKPVTAKPVTAKPVTAKPVAIKSPSKPAKLQSVPDAASGSDDPTADTPESSRSSWQWWRGGGDSAGKGEVKAEPPSSEE